MSRQATIETQSVLMPPIAGPGDYFALLKPRVMSLVLFTAFVGLVSAPQMPDPVLALVALVAIAMGAGAAGALNMWFDADIDARMRRTAERPIPAGRLYPGEALGLGMVLAVASVAMLGLLVNWAAGALLALTIGFYVLVYTMWLKRRTPQNIVIGGAAGALPPLIGYAAAHGGVTVEGLALFLIIFLWTPPHFWALALKYAGDYQAVGVPMLPNVAGERATRRQILLYSLPLVPAGLLPWALGLVGPLNGLLAGLLGIEFLRRAWAVWRDRAGAEMKLFGYSIVYLFVLFAALAVERLAMLAMGSGG
ncbi:MAG: protoheme IX farnesyltransferase [Alphaproteobacteria bacterium]|nr:MAG: protoheme IX farnesyltransferase [Alphaproteobacteria bacterium]